MATIRPRAAFRTLPSDADITGRNFGAEEVKHLQKVIESGTLRRTNGGYVSQFESEFCRRYGVDYTGCVTSASAAIHVAVAAIDPEPGDEIITSPITDMGAITPILYQAAIPIFADVDPQNYNMKAETIAPRITKRTRAIIVTHLFGNVCDMDPILELAAAHRLPVIEDAGHALFAAYKGRQAGTLGDIGCFSLHQSSHMTAGDGGFVITSNEQYAGRMDHFIRGAWETDAPSPENQILALNYRMNELQGAVALAQLDKVDRVIQAKIKNAALMDILITGVPGVLPPATTPHSRHVYLKYCLSIDDNQIQGGADAFAARLQERGIRAVPRYIREPAFMSEVLREQRTFGGSGFPFRGPHRKGLPAVRYHIEEYTGATSALAKACVLPWNEFFTEDDVRYIADAVRETSSELRG